MSIHVYHPGPKCLNQKYLSQQDDSKVRLSLRLVQALFVALLIFVAFAPLDTSPASAQDKDDRVLSSVGEETSNATGFIIPPFIFTAPPLPQTQPQLAPPLPAVQAQPALGPQPANASQQAANPQPATPQATTDGLAGLTGYGFGESPVGIGLDILSNPDDMELRSTAIDLSLVQASENFVMPAIEGGERWIRVDLGNQQVVAYQGDSPQRAFVVSTGLPIFQTVTGEFRIRLKVAEQTMSGVGYSLPGVKWVQYFYGEYAFHGSYWHSDFGVPKSHGCVNMTNADAKWLFEFAGPTWDEETVWFRPSADNPGTLVVVHQ